MLTTLQRVGGSIGTALLAVELSNQARAALGSASAGNGGLLQTLSPNVRAQVAAPLASAFGATFWWALGATLVALFPASILAITQRRGRQPAASDEPQPAGAVNAPGALLEALPGRRARTAVGRAHIVCSSDGVTLTAPHLAVASAAGEGDGPGRPDERYGVQLSSAGVT